MDVASTLQTRTMWWLGAVDESTLYWGQCYTEMFYSPKTGYMCLCDVCHCVPSATCHWRTTGEAVWLWFHTPSKYTCCL